MKVTPVTEKYFGQSIGNGQDPDEPYDKAAQSSKDNWKLSGRGSRGGGSKPTPQAGIMKRGSAGGKNSAPKSPQKLRG